MNYEEFDAIILTDFLHHINFEGQTKIINYSYKNLKKGGILIIKDVDKKPTISFFLIGNLDKLMNLGDKIYFFSTESLVKRLKNAGFQVKMLNNYKKGYACETLFVCRKN